MTERLQPVDARVFSGTGNSLRVARWFAGAGGDVQMMEAPTAGTLRPDSLLLIACPTHGFTMPTSVLRFIWSLPRGARRNAAVLVTRAGMLIGRWHPPGLAGTAPFLIALVLWLRGYRVLGAASVNMPSNWTSLHPGLPPTSTAAILKRAEAQVQHFAGLVRDGRRHWLTANLLYELLSGLALAPISLLYVLFAGRLLGQFFFASSDCTGCGQCALACPTNAITMRGLQARPEWSTRCTSCMRCMAFCPRRAIEASWLWGAASTALSLAPLGVWQLAGAPTLTGNWWSDLTLLSALCLVFAALVVPPLSTLLWRGLQRRAFNRLFTRLTPTHWWRRFRQPGTRLKELAPSLTKRR